MTTELNTEVMRRALDAAKRSLDTDDVPVGAVVLDASGQIIGEGWNTREGDDDPCGHAEIMALRAAGKHCGRWNLSGCTLVVTLEPCTMCAGAIVQARIGRLVFGAWDSKAGAAGSMRDVVRDSRLNHQVEVIAGVCAGESRELLREFFETRRSQDTEEEDLGGEVVPSDSASDEGGASEEAPLSVNDTISVDGTDTHNVSEEIEATSPVEDKASAESEGISSAAPAVAAFAGMTATAGILSGSEVPSEDDTDISAETSDDAVEEVDATADTQVVSETESATESVRGEEYESPAENDEQNADTDTQADSPEVPVSSWAALVNNDDEPSSADRSETANGNADDTVSTAQTALEGQTVREEQAASQEQSEDHAIHHHNAPPVRLAASPPPPAPPSDPHHALAIARAAAAAAEKARQEELAESNGSAEVPDEPTGVPDEPAEVADEPTKAPGEAESPEGPAELAPEGSVELPPEVDGVIIEDDPVENFALPRTSTVTDAEISATVAAPEEEDASGDEARLDDTNGLDIDSDHHGDVESGDTNSADETAFESPLEDATGAAEAETQDVSDEAEAGIVEGDSEAEEPQLEGAHGGEPTSEVPASEVPVEEAAEFSPSPAAAAWLMPDAPVSVPETTEDDTEYVAMAGDGPGSTGSDSALSDDSADQSVLHEEEHVAEAPAEFGWLKTPAQAHDTSEEDDIEQLSEVNSADADTADAADSAEEPQGPAGDTEGSVGEDLTTDGAHEDASSSASVWTPPLPKIPYPAAVNSDDNPDKSGIEIIAEEVNSTRIIDDIPAEAPVLEGNAIDVDEDKDAESFISAAREFAATADEHHFAADFDAPGADGDDTIGADSGEEPQQLAEDSDQAPVEPNIEEHPEDEAFEEALPGGPSAEEHWDVEETTLSEAHSEREDPSNVAVGRETANHYDSPASVEGETRGESAVSIPPEVSIEPGDSADMEQISEGEAAHEAELYQEDSALHVDASESEEEPQETAENHDSHGPTTAPTRRVHRAHLTTTGLNPEDFPKRADIHGVRSTVDNRGAYGRLRAVDSPPPSSHEEEATEEEVTTQGAETRPEDNNVTPILPDEQRTESPEPADHATDHQPDTFGTGALDTPVTGLGGYVSRRVNAQATHDSEGDEPDTSDTIDLRPVVDAITAHEAALASGEEGTRELSDTQLHFLKLQGGVGDDEANPDFDAPVDTNHGGAGEEAQAEADSAPTPIPSRRSVLRAALAQAGLKRTTFLSLGEDEGGAGAETSTGGAEAAETSGPAEMTPPDLPEHVVDRQSADTAASDTPAGIIRTPIASRGPRTGIFDAVKPAGTTGPIPSVTTTGALASGDGADMPVGSEQKGTPHTPNPAEAIDALGSTGIGRAGGFDSGPSGDARPTAEGPSLDGEAPGVATNVSHAPDNPQEDLTETRVIRGRRPLFPPVGVSTPPQGTPVETSAGFAVPEQHSPVQGMPPVNTPVVPSPPPPATPPVAVTPPPPPVAPESAPNPPGGVPLGSGPVPVPPVEGVPSAQAPSPAGHTPVHGAPLPPPQGAPVVPAGHVPPGSAAPIPHDSARAAGPGQPGETRNPVTPVDPRGNGPFGQAPAPDSVRSGAPTSYPDAASPDTPGRPMPPLRSESPQRPPQSARSGPMMGVFAKAAKLAGSIPPPEEALSVPTEVPGSIEGAGIPAAETGLADTGVLPGVGLPADAGISPEGLNPPEAAPELPAEIPGEEPEDDTEEAFKKLPKWLTRRGRQKPTPKH
ncbi:MAG: tRNA adenosine(34) deaminase TadA [Actinomycetaceae bacterium]|nr:tRNA adenosine(34) deaminase TadA [Actinomycetaceae bacterium]